MIKGPYIKHICGKNLKQCKVDLIKFCRICKKYVKRLDKSFENLHNVQNISEDLQKMIIKLQIENFMEVDMHIDMFNKYFISSSQMLGEKLFRIDLCDFNFYMRKLEETC